jgi:hypothetical protein
MNKSELSIMKQIRRFSFFWMILFSTVVESGGAVPLSGVSVPEVKKVDIVIPANATKQIIKAANELELFLQPVFPSYEFSVTTNTKTSGLKILFGTVDLLTPSPSFIKDIPVQEEGFMIRCLSDKTVVIASKSIKGLFNAVYSLLEKLGYGFYLSYEAAPPSKKELSFKEWEMSDYPLTNERIVFDWHNFMSGCTGWNYGDWCSWIDQSAKMRFNTIMVHAYGNNPMFSFEYNGLKKEVGYLTTSISGRDWGSQHIKDVRRLPGGELFREPVFGSQAAMVPDSQRGEAATNLMARVFEHASDMSMKIVFAVDVDTWSANPKNIIESLPPACRIKLEPQDIVNPETAEGYQYYKAQIKSLLNNYPQISTICIWVRTGATLWRNIKTSQFPESWTKEWNQIIIRHPELTTDNLGPSTFAFSKIVTAFQKALKELKHDDITLGFGSWGWEFLPSAGLLLPDYCALMPLDYRIIFDSEETRAIHSKIGANRKLIPIVWAHHDDHRYFGRPYAPYSDFNNLLKERNASGFGIIHWTTRPLDLYFKGLVDQVWQSSENKSIASIIADYNKTIMGSTQDPLMDYMTEWILRGPMFGRETTEHFFDLGKQISGENYEPTEVTLNLIRKRSDILKKVNPAELSGFGSKVLDYYSSMEVYYESLFQNQDKFTKAYSYLGRQSIDSATSILQTVTPEKTIELYAKASIILPITSGEKAAVISMGARWLPDFVNLKQRARMTDICYKFEATQHDTLAQFPGTTTYSIDRNKILWSCLGEREIKGGVAGVFESKEASDLPENSLSFMVFKAPFSVPVVTIGKNPLAPGKYKLEIKYVDSASEGDGCKLFLVSKNSRISLQTNSVYPGTKLRTITTQIEIQKDEKHSLEIDPGKSGKFFTNLIIKPI